jgi:hypothetical protein
MKSQSKFNIPPTTERVKSQKPIGKIRMSRVDSILNHTGGDMGKAEQLAKEKSKLDYQLMLAVQGKTEQAWKVVKELEQERPECNRSAFNRGWFYLAKGELSKGLTLLEKGRAIGAWGNEDDLGGMYSARWDGKQNLKNKFVLIYMEGGHGDEILNVRFVKQLVDKGAKVIIACRPTLAPLFARIEGVSAVAQADILKGVWHDYYIPSFSLAHLLGCEYEELKGESYITPNDRCVKRFSNYIKKDGFKVGIRWGGNPEFEYQQMRAFPFKGFYDAVNQEGVDLYSLQLSDSSHIDVSKYNITDLEEHLTDWEQTAGAIANLDLVITSCTSIAHLSAAMGKETWVIIPSMPYYVWAVPGSKSAWYDSVNLIRQEEFGNWDKPFTKVKQELEIRKWQK